MGVPVGVRANLALALARGRFDVVHGFEPGLPEPLLPGAARDRALDGGQLPLARAARVSARHGRSASGCSAASTRCSPPARRSPRPRPSASPATTGLLPVGVDTELFRPGHEAPADRARVALDRARRRRAALIRVLRELPDWELVLLRTRPLAGRPSVPHAPCAGACTSRTPAMRRRGRRLLAEAAVFVPALEGSRAARARGRGLPARAIADPPGCWPSSPSSPPRPWPGSPRTRRVRRELQARGAGASREAERSTSSPAELERALPRARATAPARAARAKRRPARRAATGSSATCTCTRAGRTTARSTSATCSTTPRRSGSARSPSPTTTSSAARSRRSSRRARRELIVIPGEEIKTDEQGEVIGLFLERGDPARPVLRGHDRRDPRAGRARLRPPPLRPAARDSRRRRRCTATWPRSTCSRSTTRGCSSRRSTTRRSASPASTT